MDSGRPNVVLICVDQWRGDCLGIEGHPVVETPFLDQMASEGCRFRRAYSATPTCLPARASLHTGLCPKTHGRIGYRDGVPWRYPHTLAGEFTRHGYQTQAIGKMHVYPERAQLGFQNVILHDGYLHFVRKNAEDLCRTDDYLPWLRTQLGRDSDHFETGLNCNGMVARPWDKPEFTHPTNYVVSQGIDFLKRRDPTKPFFLFLSFHGPHPPLDPPGWAFEQYLNRDMPAPPEGDWAEYLAPHATPHRMDPFVAKLKPETLQRARAAYYGLMTHIDHQINRFVETVMDENLHHNTVYCFVSDHGEMLGDHNLFRKGYPYEGSSRIPLIIAGPREMCDRNGQSVDAVVELRDIMPTLLQAAGLPVPESVEGRSLLPLMRGADSDWRSYLHGEHSLFGQSIQWLTDGSAKYVWFSGDGHEQLFDLVDDPEERRDLAGRPEWRERLELWRGRLVEELTGREEGFCDGGGLVPGRPALSCLSHILQEGASQ